MARAIGDTCGVEKTPRTSFDFSQGRQDEARLGTELLRGSDATSRRSGVAVPERVVDRE
jgi:hypothetical protein